MMNLMSPIYKELLEINKKSGQRVWGLTGDLSQNTHPLTPKQNSSQELVEQEQVARNEEDDAIKIRASPHLPSWF